MSQFFWKERQRHPLKILSPALIIVDIQKYFCHPSGRAYLPGVEKILSNLQALMETFRRKSFPIVFTIHVSNSQRMKDWWNDDLEPHEAEPCLSLEGAIKIEKDTYDAFYNTKLEDVLRSYGVNQVFITGVRTHLCVETTARSAFVRNFDVVVVYDACYEREDWHHFSSLKNLAHGFAIIASTEEVLCALR
ncbi:isochorismatase family protein [Pseudothermotoga sp.]|uniref:isochorismatase family protein n=1 Tax=Pseudothermotoga sp. TaxID=2033661 RepID=UPI0031F6AE15